MRDEEEKRGLFGIRPVSYNPSKFISGKTYWGFTYVAPPKGVSEGLHAFKQKGKPVIVFSEPALKNEYFSGPASVLPTIAKYPKNILSNINMVWSGSPMIASKFGSDNDIAGYYQPGSKPVIHLSEYAFSRTLPHEIAHHIDYTKAEHHPQRWHLGRAFAPSEHGRKNDEEDYAETISFLQTEGKPQFKEKYRNMFAIHRLNPNPESYHYDLRTPQPKEKYDEERAKRVGIFEQAVKGYGLPRRINTSPQSPAVPKAYRAGDLKSELIEKPFYYYDIKSPLLYTADTSPTAYYRKEGMVARAKISPVPKEYRSEPSKEELQAIKENNGADEHARIQRRTRGDERPWTVEMGVHVPDPKEYRSKILVGDDYVPTEYYGWRLESWSEPQPKYGKKFMFRSKQFTPRLSVSLKPEQKVISEEKKKNVAGLLWDISAVPTEGLLSIYRPTTFSLGSLKGAPKRYRESYQYFKERNRPELSNVIPVSRERFIERETGKRMSHLYHPPAVGATMATATIYSPFVSHNIQIETHDKPGPRSRAGDYSDALKRVRMYAHTYKNPKNPSTPIHEFAHSIHYSLLKPNYAPGEPHFYSRWEEISQKTRRKGGSPSIYGTKDSHEDFAESFVQYIKDKSKLSPERISFFEDLEQSFVSKGNTKFPTEKEISDFIAIPSELRKEPTEEETSGFAESAREKKYKEGYVLSPESAYEDYIPHYRRSPFGLPEVGTDLGENIIEIRKKEYKSPELNLSRVVPMELSLEPSEKEIEGFAEGELSVKGAINEPFYSFGSFKGLEKFTPVESERKAEAESREYAGSEEQIEKEAEAISKKKG